MPKIGASATASEMFSNLKSRLGFSQEQGERSGAGDDFGEYDDFDDDGFSEQYDSEFAGYGADYDENAPVGAFRPATTRSGRFGRADSTPNLVSIDDVKANTPLPDKTSSSRRPGSRSLIDDRTPAQSSPAYNASLRDRERETGSNARSEGLNSLFEPSSSTFEPYSAAPAKSFTTARSLTVVRPSSYSDAERVARSLKSGDVVVLAMRGTTSDLMQRILDFSFGAASVLDANVECPAERVFAIARGQGLTEDEKRNLRNQGVL